MLALDNCCEDLINDSKPNKRLQLGLEKTSSFQFNHSLSSHFTRKVYKILGC